MSDNTGEVEESSNYSSEVKESEEEEKYPEEVLRDQLTPYIDSLFDEQDGYYEVLSQIAIVDGSKRTFKLENGKTYYIGLVPVSSSTTDHCLPL